MSARINIGRADLIAAKGIRIRQLSASNGKRAFLREDGITETYSDEEFTALTNRSDYRLQVGFYDRGGAPGPTNIEKPSIATLNPRDRAETIRRHKYILALIKDYHLGTVRIIDAELTQWAIDRQLEIDGEGIRDEAEQELEPQNPAKKTRKRRSGKPKIDPKTLKAAKGKEEPAGRTLRRWWTNYRADPQIMSLKPNYGACGYYGIHATSEVEAIITEELQRYLTPERVEKKNILDAVEARVKAYNNELKAQRQAGTADPQRDLLKAPKIGMINHAIDQLDPYLVLSKRMGDEYARAVMPWRDPVLKALVPGQQVEIDAYRVHVRTLMTWSGVWNSLTDDERGRIKKCRRWLTIAIDRATRVVLALWLHDTVDAPNAVEVLKMIESDKTRYSIAAGCQSLWRHRCGVMVVIMDGGYVSEEIRAALADARATVEYPQAGEAKMRGTVERIFRTVSFQLVGILKGKTFSDVVQRKPYNSDAHAGWTDDELAWAFITWVVDIYHNTIHSELMCTPNEAWSKHEQLYEITAPRDAHGRRTNFGIRVDRTIQATGFTVLGNEYRDHDENGIMGRYFHDPRREYTICIDPDNIGAISVLVDDIAISVPCTDPKMEGVHVADWMETLETMQRDNPFVSWVEREHAHEAYARIFEKNDKVGMRSSLMSRVPSAGKVKQFEDMHMRNFRITDPAPEQQSDVLGTVVDAIGVSDLSRIDFDGENEDYGGASDISDATGLDSASDAPTPSEPLNAPASASSSGGETKDGAAAASTPIESGRKTYDLED